MIIDLLLLTCERKANKHVVHEDKRGQKKRFISKKLYQNYINKYLFKKLPAVTQQCP